MNTKLLIDVIVQQTTVLIAELSRATGRCATGFFYCGQAVQGGPETREEIE